MSGRHPQIIRVNAETRKTPGSTGEIALVADLLLKKFRPQLGWHIRIILVDDARIIALNRKYFLRSAPTDVIAFNLSDDNDPVLQGEIYLDTEQAKRQAPEYGASWREELARLAAHGTLHLLGYQDGDARQKREMTRMENAVLHKFKLFAGQ